MRAFCRVALAMSFAITNAFAQENKANFPCGDVTKLDFRNLMISIGKRIFAFQNGIALNYDAPDVSKAPDWQAEIGRDTVVHPVSGTTVRFLFVQDSHLTGSGWNYWLVGYKCSDGNLQQVFGRNGQSLEIEHLDDSGIVVSKWLKYGSRVRTYWSYGWNKKRSIYVLLSSWSGIDPKQGAPKSR